MTKIAFLSPVQEDIRSVEILMHAQADGYHPDIKAALELLLSSGGKRIRPAITLLTGRMLGAPQDRLVTIAAAIELLHTATLVHDDLIDAALLRRNVPTLNSQWSPGATVLTGDFLFARAAKLSAETDSVAVMKLFAQTLTTIVNGEITQLFGNRCLPDRDGYFTRIYAKTASLFETATTSAAIVSSAGETATEALRQFGYSIGMAFQIVDDVLDFTGDELTLGKPVGSDIRQGLITLPAIYYIESHPEDQDVKTLLDGSFSGDSRSMDRLISAIRKSSAVYAALQEADHFTQRGLTALRLLPASPERHSLEELAEYIVQRNI